MAVGVRNKYGVALSAETVVEKVKTMCPCWNGHNTKRMPIEWNAVVDANPIGASFAIGDKLYRIKVEAKAIDTFDEAYAEVTSLQTMLFPTATISTSTDGHGLHSVALMRPFPGQRKIQALNSWGTSEMYMDVAPTNFQSAMRLEPEIVFLEKDGRPVEIPAVLNIFTVTLGQGLFQVVHCRNCTLNTYTHLAGQQTRAEMVPSLDSHSLSTTALRSGLTEFFSGNGGSKLIKECLAFASTEDLRAYRAVSRFAAGNILRCIVCRNLHVCGRSCRDLLPVDSMPQLHLASTNATVVTRLWELGRSSSGRPCWKMRPMPPNSGKWVARARASPDKVQGSDSHYDGVGLCLAERPIESDGIMGTWRMNLLGTHLPELGGITPGFMIEGVLFSPDAPVTHQTGRIEADDTITMLYDSDSGELHLWKNNQQGFNTLQVQTTAKRPGVDWSNALLAPPHHTQRVKCGPVCFASWGGGGGDNQGGPIETWGRISRFQPILGHPPHRLASGGQSAD
jgi:hypothetical protein